jgi:hypothetical protein
MELQHQNCLKDYLARDFSKFVTFGGLFMEFGESCESERIDMSKVTRSGINLLEM